MEVTENDSNSENIYINMEDAEKTSNQSEIYDNIDPDTTTKIPGFAGACERRKVNFSKMAAVVLGLLCVLLLAVITGLCTKHNKVLHQMQSSYENIIVERDRLQSSNENITVERDRLQSSYENIIVERDRLQSSNENITVERDRLQSRYNTLKSERDEMQKKLTEIDSCPFGWMGYLSSCYHISKETTWEESRQDCRREGADLVIINSREEQVFVSEFKRNLWIGLTDRYQEGQWQWVDNTPLKSGYWKNREPNNGNMFGEEDCAEVVYPVFPVIPAASNWNDIPCSRTLPGLCEKKIWCSTQ
ncbi:C-type lectin domain family 4 member M-like [Neoarius graeffei]|uniref:C-type lectin domain family 4 member M-like n=1 Tax=Neoarius graeffei TaxID=443677 RepID=UPI00298D111A|nr:C-type lectin domain family 4 member M-like [Neoarius graeffei]